MVTRACQQKAEQRDAKIKAFKEAYAKEIESFSEELSTKILQSKLPELIEMLRSKTITSKALVLFYCSAAIKAHESTNCLTEIMFEEAIKKAESMDEYLEKEGRLFGPLHGIPFSIKDTFNIEGFDSTIGLIKNCDKIKQNTANLVQFIVSQGGIPFVKTNVPQTLMSFECSNPVWGTTTNYHNKKMSPGGSSGGEAALISAMGSKIGLGSDIGGSLRIPAHFSGICSLKPSYHRLSYLGSTACKPVNHAIEPLAGPMAATVDDLIFFCKIAFGHAAPDVIPLKYIEPSTAKKIKFAYAKVDPFIQVSPACSRAVSVAVEALRSNGHEVVEFEYPPSFSKLMVLFYQLMSADGWRFYFKQLEDEPREQVLRNLLRYAALPNCIKSMTSWMARLFLKDQRALDLISAISSKSSYEVLKIQLQVQEITQEFNKFMADSGIDVIISPVHVLPATPNGSFGHIHFCAAYTFAWNLLNQPIGVLPTTKFSAESDIQKDAWPRPFTKSAIFSPNLLERAAQHFYPATDAFEGLPLGVQIIGASNCDELVLQAMSVLEKALNKN